ncbi:MAG TPA: hypothetical protein VGN83_06575 [Falsiroseomonas sp.]|jgi:hypothetical protein|nr:hypothetical protein [Falsiroseomonas sp.]
MTSLLATRRGMLGAALTAASGGIAPLRAATVVPEAALLIAPGPQDGPTARFAADAVRGLARGLVQAAALRVAVVGGPDGITAANRFATSAPAEHPLLLLLLPGLAAQAQLVGDPRARFEPRRWPAVAGSLQPAILAGRRAPGRQPLRLATPSPAAPETAALLALEALGIAGSAVPLAAGTSAEAAVAAGAADAAVLTGPGLTERAAALGLTPWFVFDGPAGTRDPALPDLPTLGEVLPDPAAPDLVSAIRAAGAALRIRGLVVLPALTASDSVAMWRGAARRWVEAEPDMAAPGTRLLGPEPTADALVTLCPRPEVTLAYREWLHQRLGWQAS